MREPLPRKFLEQRCQGGRSVLVGQLSHPPHRGSRERRLSLREVAGEGGRLLLQLLLQIAGVPDRSDPAAGPLFAGALQPVSARSVVRLPDCIGPLLFLGLQLSCHGLDFVAYAGVWCGKPLFQVMAIGPPLQQLGLEFGKPALVITDLGAEENILDLVEVVAGRMVFRPVRGPSLPSRACRVFVLSVVCDRGPSACSWVVSLAAAAL